MVLRETRQPLARTVTVSIASFIIGIGFTGEKSQYAWSGQLKMEEDFSKNV